MNKPDIKGTFEKVKKKVKAVASEAKEDAVLVVEVVKENKEVLAGLVLAGGAVASSGVSAHMKRRERKRDRDEKRCDIYDPHRGRHYYLRRPMSRDEEREFERRAKSGEESYYDILDDMGLLD